MPVPPFPPPPATSGTGQGWGSGTPGTADGTQTQAIPASAAALPSWPASTGTVYGAPTAHTTVALPTGDPVENSGSLTGHILAQGWPDTVPTKSHTTRVVAVLAIGLGIVVAVGLLLVLAAGDVFGAFFEGLLKG